MDSAGLRTYTRDDADRITQIVDAQNSALNQGYGYDNLDRLTSVTKSSGNQSFTYDANGNRLSYGNGAASSTYSILSTKNWISSITGSQARTYTHNAVGNVTAYSNLTLTYSDRERLRQVTVGTATNNYYVNGLGERVRKSLSPSGNHYYAYDEAGHLIGEYNGNNLIQETVWLGDTPVATLRPGTPVGIFYVHTDHLNAPRLVTQPSNNAQRWRWDRDPFGTTAPNENPQSLGTFSYNLRLPGQFYDSETGLHYNYMRDYDPATGRYVESDPIGLRGGINTYGYVGANPISRIDPTGEDYWVESSVPGEGGHPFHQSVCVGRYPGNAYCISFGVDEPNCLMNCKGAVYPDTSGAGKVAGGNIRYTTAAMDAEILKLFQGMLGQEARYFLAGNSCRDFSQNLFRLLRRNYPGVDRPFVELDPKSLAPRPRQDTPVQSPR